MKMRSRRGRLVPELTYAEANRIFHYNPRTGKIFWKIARRNIVKGQRAGCAGRDRRVITYNKVCYEEGRVCWLLYYGEWPDPEVDHRDRNGFNNKIKNLREATRLQNVANRKVPTTRKYIGVSYRPRLRAWFASIRVNRKMTHLGPFKSSKLAARAYDRMARKLHGEFAVLNNV